jgi:hypothetical protein
MLKQPRKTAYYTLLAYSGAGGQALKWVAKPLGFRFFKGAAFERCCALSPQKTRGVPTKRGKARRAEEPGDAGLSPQGTRGVPINRGKARRYTVVSGRGGEAASPREARYAGSY